MSEALSTSFVIRLSLVVVAMFGFGFGFGANLRRDVQKPSASTVKPPGPTKAARRWTNNARCACSFSPPMPPRWSGSSALGR